VLALLISSSQLGIENSSPSGKFQSFRASSIVLIQNCLVYSQFIFIYHLFIINIFYSLFSGTFNKSDYLKEFWPAAKY